MIRLIAYWLRVDWGAFRSPDRAHPAAERRRCRPAGSAPGRTARRRIDPAARGNSVPAGADRSAPAAGPAAGSSLADSLMAAALQMASCAQFHLVPGSILAGGAARRRLRRALFPIRPTDKAARRTCLMCDDPRVGRRAADVRIKRSGRRLRRRLQTGRAGVGVGVGANNARCHYQQRRRARSTSCLADEHGALVTNRRLRLLRVQSAFAFR